MVCCRAANYNGGYTMIHTNKLPVPARILIAAVMYFCVLGIVYGFATVSYRPVVL